MTKPRFPDFYIVGAPKTGTTALTFYLLQHPQIYIGRQDDSLEPPRGGGLDKRFLDVFAKDFTELGYFSSELMRADKRKTKEAYLACFADARADQIIGETTALNLGSMSAAQEIHDANPEARIIAILRDPADLLTSLQNQRQYQGIRHAYGSFDTLITADQQAENGSPRRKKEKWEKKRENYVDVCMFSEQLKRYFQVFSRDRVLVLFQEEMKRDTPGTFREVCRFLGVDPDVDVNFTTINRYKTINTRTRAWNIIRATGLVRLKYLLPRRHRYALRRRVLSFLLSHGDKPPVDKAVRARLKGIFRDEVEHLEQVLGRPVPWPDYHSDSDLKEAPPPWGGGGGGRKCNPEAPCRCDRVGPPGHGPVVAGTPGFPAHPGHRAGCARVRRGLAFWCRRLCRVRA